MPGSCILRNTLVCVLAVVACGGSPPAARSPASDAAPARIDAAPAAPGFVLAEMRGDVEVRTQAGSAAAPGVGTELTLGTRIRTGRGASARLRAPDGTEIALADGVEISLEELSATVARFSLERGKVRAAAPARGRQVT